MKPFKSIAVLVFLSIFTSLSLIGQDTSLPFTHTPCPEGVELTGQTIPLYHVLYQNEQVDTLVEPTKAGFSDASAYFNAHGGICGATVESVFSDPNEGNILAQYNGFKAQPTLPVMVAVYSSPNAQDLSDLLATDEIPALLLRGSATEAMYGDDGQTPGWVFGTNSLNVNQIGLMCRYIADHPDEYPNPKLGFLNWDEWWARAAFTDEVVDYCQAQGVTVVGARYFFDNAQKIDVYVQDLVEAGANLIYTFSPTDGVVFVARTIVELGLNDQVKLIGGSSIVDTTTAAYAAETLKDDGLPSLDGSIGIMTVSSFDETDTPGIQLVLEQAALNNRPLQTINRNYLNGWIVTDLFIETYIQTGLRVGFDAVNGAEMKTTLENIVYAPLGGVQLIDYQGGTRRDLSSDRIGVVSYLGADGVSPASADNPLLLSNADDPQSVTPIILPLTDFLPMTDLRPGGADVISGEVIATIATPVSTVLPLTNVPATNQIAFQTDRDGNSEIYLMNADGSNLSNLTNNAAEDTEPAWSPDGAQLIFTSNRAGNGEIFVMNADGSNPVNLTSSPSDERQAAWSADGTQIAFTSDQSGNDDIYVMNADGSDQTRLTEQPIKEEWAVWSPDGTQIVFTVTLSSGVGEIFIMNADGSNQTNITNNATDDISFTWSKDGNQILFTSTRGGDYDLYRMNADGSNVTPLTDNAADDYYGSWSPDEGKLAFVSTRDGNDDVFVMKADGSSSTNLTNSPYTDVHPVWRPETTTIAPSSEQIVFQTNRDGNYEIYVMNADGSNPINLINNPTDDLLATWSPDRTRILFTSDREGRLQLYSMAADGSEVVNLSNSDSNDLFADWSPDGTRIVFVSDTDGNNDIYVMNADGTGRSRLTSFADSEDVPVWTPDGRQIVFMVTPGTRDGDIYIMNADGTGQTNLTNHPKDDGLPSVSPDGTQISFTTDRDGSEEIWVINIDGTNPTQITQSENPVSNQWSNWSSDGTRMVFGSTRDGSMEVHVMNADGSNVINLTNSPYEEESPAWQP